MLPLIGLAGCGGSPMTVDDDGGAPDADAAVPPIALRVGGVDANTRASAVLALDDGGALVVMSSNGAVVDAPVGFIDTIVYRLARDGGVVWAAQLGDVGLFVKGWDVALGPSGDVLVTGLVNGRGTLAGQTLVATYSGFVASFDFAEGTRRWLTLLTDASGDVELMGVEVTPAGDVVVAGYSGAPTLHGQPSLGDGDIVLAWLTPEGAITRVRRYGDANEEHPTAFVRSGANLFITRKVVSPNLGQVLALELLALDAEGEVTATRPFAMPAMNEIAALAAHPGGVCAGLWHRTFTEETGSGIDWGISCHDAALAFRVHAWAIKRLSPEARGRIERARAAAAQEIAATRTTVLPLSYRKRLGLPANLELENLGRGLVCALAA